MCLRLRKVFIYSYIDKKKSCKNLFSVLYVFFEEICLDLFKIYDRFILY